MNPGKKGCVYTQPCLDSEKKERITLYNTSDESVRQTGSISVYEFRETESAVKAVLNWMENYYVDSDIRDSRKIREEIEEKKGNVSVYLITLSGNPADLMQIVPAFLLRQKHIYDSCPMIIGMAKGKEGAIQLVQDIVLECYQATGGFRIKEYLKDR